MMMSVIVMAMVMMIVMRIKMRMTMVIALTMVTVMMMELLESPEAKASLIAFSLSLIKAFGSTFLEPPISRAAPIL